MRIWVQEIEKGYGTSEFELEELSKKAIDIALMKSSEGKIRVVMILPDGFEHLKHHWEQPPPHN